jgi:hypothetical protein
MTGRHGRKDTFGNYGIVIPSVVSIANEVEGRAHRVIRLPFDFALFASSKRYAQDDRVARALKRDTWDDKAVRVLTETTALSSRA